MWTAIAGAIRLWNIVTASTGCVPARPPCAPICPPCSRRNTRAPVAAPVSRPAYHWRPFRHAARGRWSRCWMPTSGQRESLRHDASGPGRPRVAAGAATAMAPGTAHSWRHLINIPEQEGMSMSKTIVANGTPAQQVSRQTDTPALAAIYARVSTTEQADKGYSLPTQLEACQAMAQQEGYTVPDTHVFVDDYTGTSMNRPQFKRLRDLVQQHLVHAVIVHDTDRLSRKLAHLLVLQEEFEQANVTLRIVTMPTPEKTPEAQLLSNVRGIIAEYERAKILERTARGRVGRVKAGYVPGGRR